MFSFKKKTKGSAEVSLFGKSKWQSNEDINGSAVFTLPPGLEYSHCKIALRGVVTVGTEDAHRGSLQPAWRTEKFVFLGVSFDSKSKPDATSGIVRVPFRFRLDECSQLCKLSELPPSLDSKDDARGLSSLKKFEMRSQYSIMYSIVASAYSTRGLAASTTEKVTILPVAEAPPPLYASHFPGEFFTATSQSREPKQQKKTHGPRFEVSGQEPEALRLDPANFSSHSSIDIPLVIKFLPSSGTFRREDLPTQCDLKVRLMARTFVTPNGKTRVPLLGEVSNDSDSDVRTSRSHEQSFTLSIPKWERVATSFEEQFALASLPFLFNFEDDQEHRLSPSFFTPILTRSYAVEIEMRFPESSSSKIELSLPLQVGYEVDDGLDLKVLGSRVSECRL